MRDRFALKKIEIQRSLEAIPSLEHRAFFAFLYGFGARCCEAIKTRTIAFNCKDEFLFAFIPTAKNRRAPMRSVPLLLEENWLVETILAWRDLRAKELGDFLFPHSGIEESTFLRKMRLKCNLYFGVSPHFLRHSRLTHLVQFYGYTDAMLRKYTGWSTTGPAVVYVHLDSSDLANKMGGKLN